MNFLSFMQRVAGKVGFFSLNTLELIPRDILFGNPDKMSPRISPDGKRLGYVAPVDDVLNVWTKTIGEEDDKPVTDDSERGIYMFGWAYNDRHILYLQDSDGDENWHLYGVDLETGETQDFTPFEKVSTHIIASDKNYPNELIIGMNKRDEKSHDAYHLDLETGELTMRAENPGNVLSWVIDSKLQVRGKVMSRPDGGFKLMVRDDEESEWRDLVEWGMEDSLTSSPLEFTKDGRKLYLIDSRNYNTGRLVLMDLETGDTEVIAQDPQYDVASVLFHPDDKNVQGVGFMRERMEWKILDDAIREDYEKLSGLQRGDFYVYSRDRANENWLVGFDRDDGPVSYYSYNCKNKEAVFLFHNRDALNMYELAKMEPVSFTSRDGMTIHGYLTCPPDKPRTNLPMVLNVHGGPHHRDTWGFFSEAQWMANRGYACLQVNFRGSTGYGKEFLNAGDREWGARMHDDLIDAVKWAVDQGIADPARVAIYGGSYGGYAALIGAAFTPDVFCCAVDIFGPSNLNTLIRSMPPYWSAALDNLKRRIGDPDTEEDFLFSRSPLSRVDQIKIPILIAQGANDPRVKQAEAEQIVEAMDKKGISYRYELFTDEGHGFLKPQNREKFYGIAEEFLAERLGGRAEVKA